MIISTATIKKAFKVPLQLRRTAPLSREAAQLGGQQVMLETMRICFLISVYIFLAFVYLSMTDARNYLFLLFISVYIFFVFVYLSITAAGNYLYFLSCICVYFLYLCFCHLLLLIMYSVSEMTPEILYLSKESSIGVKKLCQMPPNAWIGSVSNAGQTEILMQMHFREFKLVSVMLLRLNGPEKRPNT